MNATSILDIFFTSLGGAIDAFSYFIDVYLNAENVFMLFITIVGIWLCLKLAHWTLFYSQRLLVSINRILFKVTLPRERTGGGDQGMIALAEQMYTSLHSLHRLTPVTLLFGQRHFTFEIVGKKGEITFYFSIPRAFKESVRKQINAQYPEAFLEEVDDYNVFTPHAKIAGAEYKQSEKRVFPLKTYPFQDVDPLNGIVNAFDSLEADEGVMFQLLARPLSSGWHREGSRIIHRIEKGRGLPTYGRLVTAVQDFVRFSFGLFFRPHAHEIDEEEAAILQATRRKIEKDGYEVCLRIVASANTAEKAQKRLGAIEDSLSQLDLPGINRLKRHHVTLKSRFVTDAIFRFFPIASKTMILNVEEVATLAHFPNTSVDTPNIVWLESRTAPAPKNLPEEGVVLGVNVYRAEKTVVRQLPGDRLRHAYLVGKTGMGKTNLIKNMALADIYQGKGVAVIDPHGDLIRDILTQIPPSRAEDVIYLDPSDLERPFGLNLLEYTSPEQKNFVIEETIGIFYKLFYQFAGPKFDHYLRNAILTLMADTKAGATLIDIPRIFGSDAFAAKKAVLLDNPVARAFWTDELAALSPAGKAANIGPVIEKIETFVADDIMRNILGQAHSTINFEDIMNQQKIVLINLSKGKMGELNSSLLGLILVSKFHMAIMRRAAISENQRKDFYVYIDEFQNFTTESIATIFSEARKYHVGLIVSHQYIAQLTQGIAKAVFGNVGTLMSFRVGPEDAAFLASEFAPEFSAYDLVNLPKYNACAKLMVNGKATPSFSMMTLPPSSFSNGTLARSVIEYSRERYGRDHKEVTAEIQNRFAI